MATKKQTFISNNSKSIVILFRCIVFQLTLLSLESKLSHALPEPVSLNWQSTNLPESNELLFDSLVQSKDHVTLTADQRTALDLSENGNSTTQPNLIVSSCTAFIIDFSDSAAAYTKCSILHARPLRFCENCISEYMKAKDSYNMIMEGKFHDETGALCSEAILNSDRIQIVVKTHKFVEQIWNECNCERCFDYHINSTSYELSNETLTFLQIENDTTTCFNNFTHGRDVLPFSNWTIDPAVCISCRPKYDKLNHFYEHLLEMYSDDVCMDIIDMMNSTRLIWSKEFHCSRRDVDIIPIILLSIFFCSLPVLFYVSNKIHGTKTEMKLLKQKRMRESEINNSVEEEEEQAS